MATTGDETSDEHFSDIVRNGLKCLNTSINLDHSKTIIANALRMALQPNVPANPEIHVTPTEQTKHAEYAILTVLSLAIRNTWDPIRLRSVLERLDISPTIVDELLDAFETHRDQLLARQRRIGHSLPQLTDVEWRLTCETRTSQLMADEGGELDYTVRFASGPATIARFQCNVDELQALLGKLKEIERHCARLDRDK